MRYILDNEHMKRAFNMCVKANRRKGEKIIASFSAYAYAADDETYLYRSWPYSHGERARFRIRVYPKGDYIE